MLSNSAKEIIAVTNITLLAAQSTPRLVSEIPIGDKAVSFDGHIDVFSDTSEKKASFLGKAPVQVKSTGVSEFSSGVISYAFEMDDIANFFQTGGVILFVGEVRSNGTVKLFYKSLLPLEINDILRRFKSQKSRTIQLRPLEEITLYNVCLNFLQERNRQPLELITERAFAVSDFQNYKLSSLDPVDEDSLFKEKFALYGMKNDVHIPLSLATLDEIQMGGRVSFSTGNNDYIFSTKLQIQDTNLILNLEDAFEINIDTKIGKFSYRHLEVRSLSAQLKLQPFLFDLFSCKEVQFLNQSFKFPFFSGMIDEWKDYQSFLDDLQATFHFLNIDFDTKLKYDDNFLLQLHHLINLIHYKDHRIVDGYKLGFVTFDLAEYKIILLKSNGGVYNAFSPNVSLMKIEIQSDDGERFRHSPYVLLEVEALIYALNLDLTEIKNTFDQFNPFLNTTVHAYTDRFCLNCIEASSMSGKYELLDLALYIYDKVVGTVLENNDAILINRYQIKIWKGEELSKEERVNLIYKKRDALVRGDHNLYACTCILLNNPDEAKMAIEALTSEEQVTFKEWPIYKLLLKLDDN
ncbi:hypothetical protein [Paenibacillus amylolyticus]|uniref:hypothetical protein n=1 Tax=Paenibacillus amylolyticus TaxID=1451 RepID=UPI003D954BD2